MKTKERCIGLSYDRINERLCVYCETIILRRVPKSFQRQAWESTRNVLKTLILILDIIVKIVIFKKFCTFIFRVIFDQ